MVCGPLVFVLVCLFMSVILCVSVVWLWTCKTTQKYLCSVPSPIQPRYSHHPLTVTDQYTYQCQSWRGRRDDRENTEFFWRAGQKLRLHEKRSEGKDGGEPLIYSHSQVAFMLADVGSQLLAWPER